MQFPVKCLLLTYIDTKVLVFYASTIQWSRWRCEPSRCKLVECCNLNGFIRGSINLPFFAPRPRFSSPIPLLFFGGGDESLEDGSKYNPAAISFIRDDWIFRQMRERFGRPIRLSCVPVSLEPLSTPHTKPLERPNTLSTAPSACSWRRGTSTASSPSEKTSRRGCARAQMLTPSSD